MTTNAQTVTALEAQHVLQTYKRQPVVFVRGEGTRLFDESGRAYLDFISGIGVVVLGHGHPGLAAVIADQAKTLIHTSNLYYHPLQGQLAATLSSMSGLQRAFFCNSGTEAVEACLKFARRYWYSKGVKNRTGYVALEHGFSGRTMGALSVTANAHYRDPFGPLVPGVTFVSPDDVAGLEAAVNETTAAIIAEPIQGEGGVRPLSPEFAAAIARVTKKTGTLLIADEIQCGLGRTGRPFQFQALGWSPDLVTVGKAIGSGIPIGAALVGEHVAKQIFAGDHGTTYGGNLLSTRAAIYVLEQLAGPVGGQHQGGGTGVRTAAAGASAEARRRAIGAGRRIDARPRAGGRCPAGDRRRSQVGVAGEPDGGARGSHAAAAHGVGGGD